MARNVRGRVASPRSSSTQLIFGSFIGLFVLLTLVWQHAYLKNADLSPLIAYSKDAFIKSGAANMTRNTGGESEHAYLKNADLPPLIAYSKDIFIKSGVANMTQDMGDDSESSGGEGSVIPIDLTVNFLHLINKAPGAPPEPVMAKSASPHRSPEDFLPIVTPSDVQFRWRHDAKTGANVDDLTVTAYRLLVKSVGIGDTVWDSEKVNVKENEIVREIAWGAKTSLTVGQILQWQVTLWDKQQKMSLSQWSKFAVGPEQKDWKGKWITHPSDMDVFETTTDVYKKTKDDDCVAWLNRRPLPLFRTRIVLDMPDNVASALLLVSGLGSFRASVNGVPLSTSGPIDPPFTDYSKRVMYRGFDITPFTQDPEMVIGMTMGSGWWDHRPISGMAKPELLPRGPVTVVAQVMITYKSGETILLGQTGAGRGWQVARGHIRESDLFTGEMVDLAVLSTMEGWDTAAGWTESVIPDKDNRDPYKEINKWVDTVLYRTDVTLEERVQKMSIKAGALDQKDARHFPKPTNFADPIGKLVPHEIPPVMSLERIAPDEIHDLGGGRWLFDFAKAFSGMLHFDEGLPEPFAPESYPRAHGFKKASANGDSFVTIIYGESLEMTTGDINRVLVAGLGLHDGGPRHVSKSAGATKHTHCFPDDHDAILSQKDVYVVPKGADKSVYAKGRQSHFTTHAFRFAEICCTTEPPKGVHALLYRTAVPEWGNFDSSNVVINGGYELVKNAMISNLLSVQSDCPHREKLPYGGDLVADSPAALHFFDMSAFYKKTVNDWLESQWGNGAYTETSVWQDLNDYAGIGHGAGETVWASAPPVLTVRHYQNYADKSLLEKSLPHHVRWLEFLDKHFDKEMKKIGYNEDLSDYHGETIGLSDWLALRGRDTWLTHTGFYMASARSVAYIAHMLNDEKIMIKGKEKADELKNRIAGLYMKNEKQNFDCPECNGDLTPGPEMSLFSRVVPAGSRCAVLLNYFKRTGSLWPGDEEKLFLKELKNKTLIQEMLKSGELIKDGDGYSFSWSQWEGFNEGIFAIRYSMKTLSEMGFHSIALRKASGIGFGTPEYMMSHNATTMWESFWRSEDLYSRNHPMLGALAEWMPSSAAGLSLYPNTTGGSEALFWPMFSKSASIVTYASAEQGSLRGDYAIAWRYQGLPDDKSQYNSAVVSIQIRILIPPSSKGVLRLPLPPSSSTTAIIRSAQKLPDVSSARGAAKKKCEERRGKKLGFPYNWDYDRSKQEWFKRYSSKTIGTPCDSFLFHQLMDSTDWTGEQSITKNLHSRSEQSLVPGLYEVVLKDWPLEKEEVSNNRHPRIGNINIAHGNHGPYCADPNQAEWDIADGTHII